MLPIEAITRRVHDLLAIEFAEFAGHLHLNRTIPLSQDQGEIPGIIVNQGSETPANDLTTLDRAGWTMNFSVTFSLSGQSADESTLVSDLNQMRLRTSRVIGADRSLGLRYVMDSVPSTAEEIITDVSSSVLIKELTTNWQALYICDRRNPDVSYPPNEETNS